MSGASTGRAAHIRNLAPWQKPRPWKAGSVVVITGAGSGIGRECALQYAKRGARLVLGDINEQSLKQVVEQCQQSGSQAIGVRVDVTKQEQVKEFIQTAVNHFGGIDILLLCAGIGAHHIFADTKDLSIFHKLMEVNFYGYLYCTHAAYQYLCESQGLLVAITSFSGEVGLPYRTAYCASKFAVTGFLEALRSEMKVLEEESGGRRRTFDITIVCPPTVNTNLRKNSLTTDPRLREAPSEHAISVEECAAAILDAADRRLRKAFFPWQSWLGAYLRPIVPDFVDKRIWRKAKL